MLLRRTGGHHGLLIAAAALAQVAIAIGMHWRILPPLMIKYGQQDALSYLLYLIGGGVVAFHLAEVHAWVCRHARLVGALTIAAALAAEGIYFLAQHGVTTVLGSGSDPFQPSVIPFNVGAIACGYLAGVALVRPWRSGRTKDVVRSGSDNAYGILLREDQLCHVAAGVAGHHRLTPADRGYCLRCSGSARSPTSFRPGRGGQGWRTRCARRARRSCPALSGPLRSAWSGSYRWAPPARYCGIACRNLLRHLIIAGPGLGGRGRPGPAGK